MKKELEKWKRAKNWASGSWFDSGSKLGISLKNLLFVQILFGFFALLSTNVDWKSVSVVPKASLDILDIETINKVDTVTQLAKELPPRRGCGGCSAILRLTILPFSWPQSVNDIHTYSIFILNLILGGTTRYTLYSYSVPLFRDKRFALKLML